MSNTESITMAQERETDGFNTITLDSEESIHKLDQRMMKKSMRENGGSYRWEGEREREVGACFFFGS